MKNYFSWGWIVGIFVFAMAVTLLWPLKNDITFPTIDDSSGSVYNLVVHPTQKIGNVTKLRGGILFPERAADIANIGFLIDTQNKPLSNFAFEWKTRDGKVCLKQTSSTQKVHIWQPVWFEILPWCTIEELRQVTLTITTADPFHIKISPWRSETAHNPAFAVYTNIGKIEYFSGFFNVKPTPAHYLPRATWILHMWHWDEGWLFWFGVGAIVFLVLASAVSIAAFTTVVCGQQRHWLKAGGVVFAAAFFLAALYATFTPPFQGPDEATHFKTFAVAAQRPELQTQALELAKRAHYSRLMCHMIERLSAPCMLEPMQGDWPPSVWITGGAARSPWADWMWRGFAYLMPLSASAAWMHWGLRIFAAFYMAGFLAFAVALKIRSLSEASSEVFAAFGAFLAAIFIIPTFWHFATHNSNHPFLIAHYAVIALFAWGILSAQKMLVGEWIFLTASACIAFLCSRAALLTIIPVVACLTIRFFLLGMQKTRLKNIIIELIPSISLFLIPILLLWLFRAHPYGAFFVPFITPNTSGLMLFFGGIILGSAGLLGTAYLGKRLSELSYHNINMNWLLHCCIVFGLLVFIGMLLSPLYSNATQLGIVHKLAINSSDRIWYTWDVVRKFYTNSNPLRDDFLLIRSFWAGFGCPEVVFPKQITQLIQTLLWAGWSYAIVQAARQKHRVELISLLLLLLTLFVWLAISAYFTLPTTVHGRYLVGFYLLWIGGGIIGIQRFLATKALPMPIVFSCVFLGMHALTFAALGFRYYGF